MTNDIEVSKKTYHATIPLCSELPKTPHGFPAAHCRLTLYHDVTVQYTLPLSRRMSVLKVHTYFKGTYMYTEYTLLKYN